MNVPRWRPFQFRKQTRLSDEQRRLIDGYSGGRIYAGKSAAEETRGIIERFVEGRPVEEDVPDAVSIHSIKNKEGEMTFILGRPLDQPVDFAQEYSAVIHPANDGFSVVRVYRGDEQYSSSIVQSERAVPFAAAEVQLLNKRGY